VASYVVDGLTIPVAVTDQPALNFCNTRASWGSPTPKEYLHTHAHLTVWARENGLVRPTEVPKQRRLAAAEPDRAGEVVSRAVAFRSALYAALLGTAGPREWATVNAEVRAAGAAASLVPSPGRGSASWDIEERSTVELPLSAVVWSAAHLLTSSLAGVVAACPGQGCGWVFADPRGRRRWCSMAWCGNRSKARRHAERSRSG
jgi:predicted RNA-binding Zn ribbon-like protein